MRGIVRVGLWVAAAGSLACTLYTGRHNSSLLLVALFAIWVLTPFAGLAWINRLADSARRDIAAAIGASSLVVCISSLAIYVAIAASRPGHHTAFAFLVVPATSWLTILTMWVASRITQRR
jgi:hypothetical protein